jgi:hypothetical protein
VKFKAFADFETKAIWFSPVALWQDPDDFSGRCESTPYEFDLSIWLERY